VEKYDSAYLSTADIEHRLHGSSGGVVTALLAHGLAAGHYDGALVMGYDENSPTHARAFVARNITDLARSPRSKYQLTTLFPALKEVASKDGRYAIVGLPCQIEAVRRACKTIEKLAKRIVLTVSVFCGHNATRAMTDAIINAMHGNPARVRGIDYRFSDWAKFGFKIAEADGAQRVSPVFHDFWGGLHFCPPVCNTCLDFTGVHADISCGDAWLPELMKTDKTGTSLILVRTREGHRALQAAAASGNLQLLPAPPDALRRSNGRQLAHKKLRVKTRIALRRLMGAKTPPMPYPEISTGIRFLPSALYNTLWPAIVENLHKRNMLGILPSWVLKASRIARNRLEALEDRLAGTSRILKAYDTACSSGRAKG
jgi:coenzyme F420 hydrogenase subunit beta